MMGLSKSQFAEYEDEGTANRLILEAAEQAAINAAIKAADCTD